MATKELIRTQYDDYTEKELLLYVNKKSKMSFIDLALAVTGLGTGVVGDWLEEKGAGEIAKRLSATLSGLGYALAFGEIFNMIQDDIEAKELEKEIVKMKDNDSMRIITKTYMWLSGSGNHTGYTTEVTYKII